jgi:hypothetical protein
MRQRLAALEERPFGLLFAGQAVSLLGDGMVGVALAFAVLGLTGSASDLGIVLAARTIPAPAVVTAAGGLLAGGGLVVANNLWETTQQRHVPRELLSRVSSYDWFGSLALVPVGMLVWGPVADQIGVSTALWIAFAQLASILVLLAVREIRELPAYRS